MILDSKEIQNYIQNHTSPEPDILKELTRQTYIQISKPRMLSGFIQGRVLKMFVQMIKPKRVLELGTFTGYSALCIAEGLSNDAIIDTIEVDDELYEFATSFFKMSGLGHKINMIIGDALDLLPKLSNSYDMVFIDANKRHYLKYYNLLFDSVSSGGYILADNVLWDGHVLKDDDKLKSNDDQTRGIKEFNDFVMNDQRVENILFPLRDGLMIVRKL